MLILARVAMRVEVDRRHDERSERGRGQVHNPDVVRRQDRHVGRMRHRGGRVEDHPDVVEARQRKQPFDAIRGGRDAETGRPAQPVEPGFMLASRADPQRPGAAQQLDHQVGADVAGADDRGVRHCGSPANTALTWPRPPISAVTRSPALDRHHRARARRTSRLAAGAAGRTTWRWRRARRPRRPDGRGSAAPDPVDTSAPPRHSRIGAGRQV